MRNTTLAIAWVKDAISLMQSSFDENLKTEKQNIISGIRDYKLPADFVSIKTVSVLDTSDDDKYKSIARIAGELVIQEDTNP